MPKSCRARMQIVPISRCEALGDSKKSAKLTPSTNTASGGAPGVGSVIWSFMVGLLTFDNDAGTKAGTNRNQTLVKKNKFLFLLVFWELKWRRDRDSHTCCHKPYIY